ncbi:MAG: Na/Pi cotransporter family protein, partial [Deltaproteobacteria bacterium]|nr:Na/Pi cotransporter family protein [Deltaproteobacteria bacterium]
LTKLDVRMIESPLMVIEQSRNEILHMGRKTEQMLQQLREILNSDELDEDLVKQTFLQEEQMDIIQSEISSFLMDIIAGEIPNQLVHEAQSQLRIADEYESVSDYSVTILKLYLKLKDGNIQISSKERQDICRLHDKTVSFFKMVQTSILERNPNIVAQAHTEGNAITRLFRDIRASHLEQIAQSKTPALLSVSYMNMLNAYRRIKDHVENVAEAFAGEK